MIRIVYSRREHTVSVKGHANGGEFGRDLVCAAVSVLTYTLASFVRGLEESGNVRRIRIALLSGDAEISCTPYEDKSEETAKIFDAFCNGFALLAECYPGNVRYTKVK